MKSKLCESCVHTKVCFKDKNICGDVFVMENPMFFDNDELYRKFKEWEKAGFPCEDYLSATDVREVVLCKDCNCYQQSSFIDKHMECARSGFPVNSVDFCSRGEKRGRTDGTA